MDDAGIWGRIGEEVENSAEIGIKEVAQSSEQYLKTAKIATGTVVGGLTRAKVESWVGARMRLFSENRKDEISVAVEGTFGDEFNMKPMD